MARLGTAAQQRGCAGEAQVNVLCGVVDGLGAGLPDVKLRGGSPETDYDVPFDFVAGPPQPVQTTASERRALKRIPTPSREEKRPAFDSFHE